MTYHPNNHTGGRYGIYSKEGRKLRTEIVKYELRYRWWKKSKNKQRKLKLKMLTEKLNKLKQELQEEVEKRERIYGRKFQKRF
jgi:phosphoglycerate-specific signal transduction histidine kinase